MTYIFKISGFSSYFHGQHLYGDMKQHNFLTQKALKNVPITSLNRALNHLLRRIPNMWDPC